MPSAIVYSLVGCPWCTKVRALLRRKGYSITERKIRRGQTPLTMPNGRAPVSYPQVWINGRLVGGFEQTQRKLLR